MKSYAFQGYHDIARYLGFRLIHSTGEVYVVVGYSLIQKDSKTVFCCVHNNSPSCGIVVAVAIDVSTIVVFNVVATTIADVVHKIPAVVE